MRGSAIVVAVCLLTPTVALAHPMAPSLLQFEERTGNAYRMRWTSAAKQPIGEALEPMVPSGCHVVRDMESIFYEERASVVHERMLRCDSPLRGQTIVVAGMERATTNAVVRVDFADGSTWEALLSASQPVVAVPEIGTPRRADMSPFLKLGIEHLASGWDHVAFVVGLVMLLGFTRRLLVAITFFTIGHTATLALATLGVVQLPAALVEVGIAITLVILGLELLRDEPGLVTRWSGAAPLALGLLHGLGFARVLTDAALAPQALPVALLSFNMGVELGQLAVVLIASIIGWLWSKFAQRSVDVRWAIGYAVGTLGAFWVIERTLLWIA